MTNIVIFLESLTFLHIYVSSSSSMNLYTYDLNFRRKKMRGFVAPERGILQSISVYPKYDDYDNT